MDDEIRAIVTTELEGGVKPKAEPVWVATSSMKSEVGVKLCRVRGSDVYGEAKGVNKALHDASGGSGDDHEARGGTKLSMKHKGGVKLTV